MRNLRDFILIFGMSLSAIFFFSACNNIENDEFVIDGIVYRYSDYSEDYYVADTVDDNITNAFIQSEINDCSVSRISANAFKNCEQLVKVSIPNTITEIGDNAFARCESLREIALPDSIEELGFGSFEGCKSLISIDLPDALTEIPSSCFEWCTSLESIKMHIKFFRFHSLFQAV